MRPTSCILRRLSDFPPLLPAAGLLLLPTVALLANMGSELAQLGLSVSFFLFLLAASCWLCMSPANASPYRNACDRLLADMFAQVFGLVIIVGCSAFAALSLAFTLLQPFIPQLAPPLVLACCFWLGWQQMLLQVRSAPDVFVMRIVRYGHEPGPPMDFGGADLY